MAAPMLDKSELLPGDILLYRPYHPKFHQRIISKKTKSPYVHTAIYIGDGIVAESTFPFGVRKLSLKKSMKGSLCVAILRSQLGFGYDRPDRLKRFVENIEKHKRFYDLISVFRFEKRSKRYFEDQLVHVFENYGKFSSNEEFSKRSFFCSAFVVACYTAVGIIDKTAQVAYPPNFFSPAGLYRDPTFGWLLGFLITENDEILNKATLWEECADSNTRWW